MSEETILDDIRESIKLVKKQFNIIIDLLVHVSDALHYHNDRLQKLEKKGSE